MRKLVFLACLAVVIAGLLSSCGSLRPSSINTRDDNALETETEYDKLGVRSTTLDVDNKALDNTIKEQSFNLESGGYANSNATGWKEGIVKNRYDGRQVRFDVVRGKSLVSSYILQGGQAAIIDRLPIGKYKVNYYEYTVKGEYLENSTNLDVTNKANRSYQGQKYFWVITN